MLPKKLALRFYHHFQAITVFLLGFGNAYLNSLYYSLHIQTHKNFLAEQGPNS